VGGLKGAVFDCLLEILFKLFQELFISAKSEIFPVGSINKSSLIIKPVFIYLLGIIVALGLAVLVYILIEFFRSFSIKVLGKLAFARLFYGDIFG
jgi:hypothetical protein